MSRNGLWMIESGAVSYKETAPDSFIQTPFLSFLSHSAIPESSKQHQIHIILEMTSEWPGMASEWMNQVLSLIKRQHLIHSFRPHSAHSWVIQTFQTHPNNTRILIFLKWQQNDQEWHLNEWIRCCLLYRDSTWFIHSDPIPLIPESFSHSRLIQRTLDY